MVEFQNAEDAKTAIRKMNDVVLKGRPVFVREDRESGERIGASGSRLQASRSADVAIRQVFVGNVSPIFFMHLFICFRISIFALSHFFFFNDVLCLF